MTSKSGIMHDKKPSAINTYLELAVDQDHLWWKATSYEGSILINLKDNRYSATSFT